MEEGNGNLQSKSQVNKDNNSINDGISNGISGIKRMKLNEYFENNDKQQQHNIQQTMQQST
jgi:hypothetical protein